jgi:hypothetical protein
MSAYDVRGARLRGVDPSGLVDSVVAHPSAGSVFGQRRLPIAAEHWGKVGHTSAAFLAAVKDGRNQASAQDGNANVRSADAQAAARL